MRTRWMFAAGIVALGTATAGAGVFQDLFRGLQYAATPSGFPVFTAGDGTRVNGARTGRVRILPDQLGQGYTLEFDRTFGADSSGRPEVFDLGPLDLTLSGSTQMTAGFTRRGFLIGNLNFAAAGLDYTLRGNTGAQNVDITGQLDIGGAAEVNQFGFYNISYNLTNSASSIIVDGVLLEDEQPTNFGIGPINIQGNIYVDALAALLSSFGVDTSGLSQLFPDSPIDSIAAAIQDTLLKDDFAAALGRSIGAEPFSVAGASFAVLESYGPIPGVQGNGTIIPEPSTVALLVGGAALLLRRR